MREIITLLKASDAPEKDVSNFIRAQAGYGRKLAMSVGKNRHDAVQEIFPRHFLQTADLAGVGPSVTTAILRDLLKVRKRAANVFNSLPSGFPDHLVASIHTGIADRMRHIEELAVG